MGSIDFFSLLWWALGGAALLGAAAYGYMEYQAQLLRTQVDAIPGGLRFTAHGLTVEMRQPSKDIKVQVREHAKHTFQADGSSEPQVSTGGLTVELPATGLLMDVARVSLSVAEGEEAKPTGFSRITFTAYGKPIKTQTPTAGKAGPHPVHVLRLDQVPDPVAHDFHLFANRVRVWIDKIDAQWEAQEEARRLREQEEASRAKGLEQILVDDPSQPLTEQERDARVGAQIEKWRTAAGFKGTSTEVSYDARGKIEWLIDLDPTGRIILHAGKRTFYGSLRGAAVVGIGNELEVSVRDDFWSEDDPRLAAFRVLGGTNAEVRRAWKERLDLVIQSLGGRPHRGP